MRCVASWGADARAKSFGAASVGFTLELGAGLPGQVWVMESPIHVADLSAGSAAMPRSTGGIQSGMRCALAFPIMDANRVVGAVEFQSRQPIALDESLLEAVATLGHQIGQTLERRAVADSLRESERLKAAILASSPDGIVTTDASGRIVEFNAACETIFGCDAAALAGRPLAGIVFPPGIAPPQADVVQRALAGDASVLGRLMEIGSARADGTRFPLELSITRTAEGDRPLFTAYLRDITARRAEQRRLRSSEARFRTIANAIPQLAWMTDSTGAIVWYNQRWYDYTGTTPEAMAGWGWKSVHHPDHVERVERRLRQSFEAEAYWEDTFPLRAQDGSYRWFLSRAMTMRDEPDAENPEGRVTGWFGSNTDVTEMRDSEHSLAVARDEAEAANKAKSAFIANMSHELRTPLSAIIGYAEMLVEEIEDGSPPAELLRDMTKIEGNARHLLGLINDVLDLSKVESGKMEAFAETFDVAAVAREVAATIKSLVEKKTNQLALELQPGLGTMHSDVTRIRQVMLNLLSNAAKFTENGRITLAIHRAIDRNRPGHGHLCGQRHRDRHDAGPARQPVRALPAG